MTSRIFISYRRADSAAITGRIYDRIKQSIRNCHIFMDVEGIATGAKFSDILQEELQKSDILLVVIGPDWLNIKNEHGHRRLDEPEDYVRMELETALAHAQYIIPVLIEGAEMPPAHELPKSIQNITQFQAIDVRTKAFTRDADDLIQTLKQMLPEAWNAEPTFHSEKEEHDHFSSELMTTLIGWGIFTFSLTFVWDTATAIPASLAIYILAISLFAYWDRDREMSTTEQTAEYTGHTMIFGFSSWFISADQGMVTNVFVKDLGIFLIVGIVQTAIFSITLAALFKRRSAS